MQTATRTGGALEALPVRAWNAWRRRGLGYAVHKALRRTPGDWALIKRHLLYRDPRAYWTQRGGEDYFREQEDHPTRGARLDWVAARVAGMAPSSVLEVGCGYGKLLGAIRGRCDARLVGIDFSRSQLKMARAYLADMDGISLVWGDGGRLPFADGSFDLVVTSAVILHNDAETAERMRREVVRVGRRWAAHNEDTDTTYNRYGYDTAGWYRSNGYELEECGPIPVVGGSERENSQFCLARLWRG